MKKAIILLVAASILSSPARAANPDECAIWLCAPIGFMSPYCAKPFLKMMKRKMKFKNPFPSFSSCEVEGSPASGMDYRVFTASVWPGPRITYGDCIEKDGTDMNDSSRPGPQCFSVTGYRVFKKGEQIGGTFYSAKSYGPSYFEDENGVLTRVGEPETEEDVSERTERMLEAERRRVEEELRRERGGSLKPRY